MLVRSATLWLSQVMWTRNMVMCVLSAWSVVCSMLCPTLSSPPSLSTCVSLVATSASKPITPPPIPSTLTELAADWNEIARMMMMIAKPMAPETSRPVTANGKPPGSSMRRNSLSL